MQQDGDEQASSRVIEDPGHDDGYGHNHQTKNGKVGEEGGEGGAGPSPLN